MNDDTKFAKAHQAIGQYFSEFSELERELGEAVKVVLHLEDHGAGDIVVDILRYPSTKARLVKEAAKIATKKKDGSEISAQWKAKADKTLGKILDHNDKNRVPLSHSHLEPREDGSVKVTRQGEGPNTSKVWNFKNKIDEVRRLTERLTEIRTELSTLDVPIRGLIKFVRTHEWHPRSYLEPPLDQTQGPLLPLLEEESARLRGAGTTKSTTPAGEK